jgi:hypothetical protein
MFSAELKPSRGGAMLLPGSLTSEPLAGLVVRPRYTDSRSSKVALMDVKRSSSFAIGLVALSTLGLAAAATSQPRSEGALQLRLTFVESTPVTTIFIGMRAIRAIVDTSAGDADGALTLSHDVIEGSGATRLGDAVMIDAQGRQFSRPHFRIPVLIVDGHLFQDVDAVEALPASSLTDPSPNVIGKFFLSRYLVVIDFADANISLWPPGTVDPAGVDCGHIRIPMEGTQEERLAVSAFDMPAGRVRLSWSTSASHSLLTMSAAEKLGLEMMSRGSNGPKSFRPKSLEASGREMGPLDFAVLPQQLSEDFDGILGRDFFDQHLVCLDYVRREVRVR